MIERQKPSKTRSMSNLRKSVAGTISAKFRPKALVVDTSSKGSSAKKLSASPARNSPLNPNPPSNSNLSALNPLSPTSPTTTYYSARSNTSFRSGNSVTSPTSSNGHGGPPSAYRGVGGVGEPVARPRPRQPLSPTMHSRGSILMETRGIEDDESRRLAELAFLDF